MHPEARLIRLHAPQSRPLGDRRQHGGGAPARSRDPAGGLVHSDHALHERLPAYCNGDTPARATYEWRRGTECGFGVVGEKALGELVMEDPVRRTPFVQELWGAWVAEMLRHRRELLQLLGSHPRVLHEASYGRSSG